MADLTDLKLKEAHSDQLLVSIVWKEAESLNKKIIVGPSSPYLTILEEIPQEELLSYLDLKRAESNSCIGKWYYKRIRRDHEQLGKEGRILPPRIQKTYVQL